MAPRAWPANPIFASEGEKELFEVLIKSLSDEDAVIANARFTDPQYGDVEIDLIALIKGVGIMVFENKGGHVTYNGQAWIQTDKSGSRRIEPHQQVVKNLNSMRNFLRSAWSYGNPKSEWLLAFPGSSFGRTDIPGVPRNRIIDKSEIPEALARSIKTLNETPSRNANISADWVTKAFEALRGHSSIESDRNVALYNNYDFIREQTHARKAILSMIQENKRIYVKGPAGSGKTWLAFEQASLWAEQGLKVGIMVFNRGLESYMVRKNAQLGGKRKAAWVGTFHNFMKQIGHSAPTMQEYENEPDKFNKGMLAAVQELPDNHKFDAWIVDEAQDFHDVWWQVLEKTFKDSTTGRFALFGDLNQSIYGKRGTPWGEFAIINLRENLRNSQQIAEAVSRLGQKQIIMRGPQSYEIEFIEVANVEDVISAADDAVERLTDTELWIPGEIGLLTTKHQHPAHKELSSDIEKYWRSAWSGEEVFYSTVAGFKGLERSAIVLAIDGFHEGRNPKDVLYVGMTRARDRLICVGTEQDCDLIRLGFENV